ncbi:GNAT family N-acetyltransferase [Streptacidiphilus sp. PB12-B1b]|uniref:GNAT family N-acetyltransferase n=1 Tax=Streptacidiphilus sp. PB12-B1b TaxID=2705012 RepID=UPI0015FB2463|nr:GNAT family N-acetyltransferase [Streptacidiphilus sp. PB12-B1b]QMU76148.1 GNAT family N-acetyltransferase [Streptacidiphilus sp. PB12-B1b]
MTNRRPVRRPAAPGADAGPVLRRWRESDAAAVLAAFSAPEPALQSGRAVRDEEGAALWLLDRLRDWEAGTGYSWAVVDQRAVLLGGVAVTSVEYRHGSGWVSYWTLPEARGRGVAVAGARAAARWAFGELGLVRLELGHRTDNPASCRVALRAGFPVVGLERARLGHDGLRFDVERHTRLAADPDPDPWPGPGPG